MKKWYRVTFEACMNNDDICAMNRCFYDAMNESMDIAQCANLNICPVDAGADIVLEEADLIGCDKKTGVIKVDKQIFDDFSAGSVITVDLDCNQELVDYQMIAETDEYIEMKPLDE